MKLVFWTKVPFSKNLKSAFKDALKNIFLNLPKDKILIFELAKYIFDIQIYVRTSIKELNVNLSNRILAKRREFRKELKNQQLRLGTSSKSIDVSKIILDIISTSSELHGNIKSLEDALIVGNPVLVIANHSFAPIDGLILMNLIHKYRNDYFQLVNGNNGLISLCPEFNYRLIPVDLSEGALRTSNPSYAKASRVKAFKQSFNRLYYSGQCLIMFPAGNISKAMNWGDAIQDTRWLDGAGLLVKLFLERQKELQILPIFINTHMGSPLKSYNYQLAYLEHPTDVSAALMDAFFNPPKYIPLEIGNVIKSSNFSGKTKTEITEQLREAVYNLSDSLPIANKNTFTL